MTEQQILDDFEASLKAALDGDWPRTWQQVLEDTTALLVPLCVCGDPAVEAGHCLNCLRFTAFWQHIAVAA